ARSGPVQAGRAGSRWSIGARSLGKSGRPDGLAHAAPAAVASSAGVRRDEAAGALEQRSVSSTLAEYRPGHAGCADPRSLAGVPVGALLMLSSGFPAVAGSGLGHPGRAGPQSTGGGRSGELT